MLSRLVPGVCFFSKMNSRQENRWKSWKLSFTARIITKYSLEPFLSICGGKMSKGFLKSCKLIYISKLILGQIFVSNLGNVHRLNSRINYALLHSIRYKKQASNTKITQAYHSRSSPERYQVRPVSLQTWQLSYALINWNPDPPHPGPMWGNVGDFYGIWRHG